MPIILPHPMESLSEQAFHKLDYSVMALAFEIHNELGRFYDENIYKNKLLQKCRSKGFKAECEVEVTLTHQDFSKSLFIDLLINGSVYELKTIRSIQKPQRTQTLDYIFATNTKHGKIINFRSASVEHEFVSTTLDHEARTSFRIEASRWNTSSKNARELKTRMVDLLNDWGAFLDTHKYEEALIHFLGGEQKVVQPVEIKSGNQRLGTQKFSCLSGTDFFLLTAAKSDINRYEAHLTRLLSHTPFEQLHWINLNRSTIQFVSLEKELFCS